MTISVALTAENAAFVQAEVASGRTDSAIGLSNPSAAERLYDRIEEKVRRLADRQRLGPRRSDIRPKTRILAEPPHLILYEIEPNTDEGPITIVEIAPVVDGRRDLAGPE
ncbi:type II toxin-antitoxin system RelE/ParE family toxin [Beijerinckia sp. L45]|uniref:type II toxin-antitoxin system RelE/ParE family toxin n=1 Tax=Beijerinckia sp. L45 TaxID=1641855 RepID=UPI00131CB1F8|nr:type II toxin-antitoxin system RelE/ParE family toxin [Beijerinckia sp. L45]